MSCNFVVEIKNKVPRVISGAEYIVSDNDNYTIEIFADDEWSDFPAKTFIYAFDDGTAVFHAVEGNVDTLPVIKGAGSVYFGVCAGDIRTTMWVKIPIRGSIRRKAGEQVLEPEPAAYDAIMDMLNRHDAVLKKLDEEKAVITISGDGAPGSDVEGVKNQLYYDETAGVLYILTGEEDSLVWQKIASGGTSGGASAWGDVADKPFETVGAGLSVDEDGVLSAPSVTGASALDLFTVTPEMLGYAVEDGTAVWQRDVAGDSYTILSKYGEHADAFPNIECPVILTMHGTIGGGSSTGTDQVRRAVVEYASGVQYDTAFHIDSAGVVKAVAAAPRLLSTEKVVSYSYAHGLEAGRRYQVQFRSGSSAASADMIAMHSDVLGEDGIFSQYNADDLSANAWYITSSGYHQNSGNLIYDLCRKYVADEAFVSAATARNVRVVEMHTDDDGTIVARSKNGTEYEEVSAYTLFGWIEDGDCAIVLVDSRSVDGSDVNARAEYTLVNVQRNADYTGQIMFATPANPIPGTLRNVYVFNAATKQSSGVLEYTIVFAQVPNVMADTAYMDEILLSSQMDASAPSICNNGGALELCNPASPMNCAAPSMPVLWDEMNIVMDGMAQAFVKAPDTGTVGQALVVDAVDESGKPTAWKTVDMAAGGSTESAWKTVTYTVGSADDPVTAAQIDLPSASIAEMDVIFALYSAKDITKLEAKIFVGGKTGANRLIGKIGNFYTSAQTVRSGYASLEKRVDMWKVIYTPTAGIASGTNNAEMRYLTYASDYIYMISAETDVPFYGDATIIYREG